MKTAIIFPAYNAATTLSLLLDTIREQTIQPDYILAIETSSTDATVDILKSYNVSYYTIKADDFNHGTTRKYATSLIDADIYIFLTQDVSFVDENALHNILSVFCDSKVGCAYGRQLPNKNADVLARHLRSFVYPEASIIKTYEDRKCLGIWTCSNSDNFAAYRKEALFAVGGMPENILFGEDMYVAAKMLMQGWKIVYCANAMIYHSHNYTLSQEFKRHFDAGVFHAMNPWIFKNFPGRIGDGIAYLKSVFLYCIKCKEYLVLPRVLGSVFIECFGFFVGRYYKLVPSPIRKKISMCSCFWQ